MSRRIATIFVGLLRGINVGGHNKMPMAELRSLLSTIGLDQVQTYIQSGNLVFISADAQKDIESRIEQAIKRRFHLTIPVLVRSAADWCDYAECNPFPDAVKTEPNRVMLALSKKPPISGVADALQKRTTDGETIIRTGNALWIHFPNGVGKSKLTPALLDRHAGSPVTLRNWLTVLKLRELSERIAA